MSLCLEKKKKKKDKCEDFTFHGFDEDADVREKIGLFGFGNETNQRPKEINEVGI